MSYGRILVVEDETGDRRSQRLLRSMEHDGYDVHRCTTGRAAIEDVRRLAPDLVVLGCHLPDMDGLAVCRALRLTSDLPIILRTGRTDEQATINGLASGADDFVSKTMTDPELLARVRAILHRTRRDEGDRGDRADRALRSMEAAGVCVDELHHQVHVQGSPVDLTPTEFRLIHALVGEPGRIFSRRQFIQRAFDVDFGGFDRNVDSHIGNLRKKLGIEPSPICTVYGIGYKLDARS